MKNKLVIAAAGSGKTTFLIEEALKVTDGNVLITTFTEANRDEIKKKILNKKKYIPKNITIQTWFSFLLEHGVRPYQSILNKVLHDKRIGFYLVQGKSGIRYINKKGIPIYWGEADFFKYYFTDDFKIYSDKISKFVYESDKKHNNEVIKRTSRIYKHIFVDEVQDLAGWDLEIIKLLMLSDANILMVGDPRQAIYETNDSSKHKQYRQGKISTFLEEQIKKDTFVIDIDSLKVSHRNNSAICTFSSKLFPSLSIVVPCTCANCRITINHTGIFLIKNKDLANYIQIFKPQILRYSNANVSELTYGMSKGLTFDRVLIHPTEKIKQYLVDGDLKKIESICAKLYVAVTRAKHSVGIVYDFEDSDQFITGILKYSDKD